ncbi:MAG: UDP-N-acetylglucosamine 2-epimerase (hydrolyzing) [Cyclobacteriaceae bacterium]|nr:UDP-N-acetylglucosamine 2-epimerase (hydrolyzing) [Cyclobacteriaceae bacterium]
MSKRKICVVITARPSYSRVKSALEAINKHDDLELQLVVAGSALLDRYGSAIDYIVKDGFHINEQVFMVLEGENPMSMAKTTGLGVLELANIFYNLKPDVVISIADRYETIATAIAASYQNIPLAHIQGGEVTGNIDEKVRHAVTKLADIHLVASENARERVIKMGEDPEYVFNTGCPSIDLAAEIQLSPSLDFDPYDKYGGVGSLPDLSKKYIVVMQHPVTTEYKESRNQVAQTLEAVHQSRLPALWFWPNVDAGADGTSTGIRSFREFNPNNNIHFFKNMEPTDFLRLLYNSRCLVGNSSTGIRECAFLGVPVVNIGSRQNRRERGKNVIDVNYSKEEILSAIQKQIVHGQYPADHVYGDSKAGHKIADVLATVPLRFHKTITY